jgi:hypothetical protein
MKELPEAVVDSIKKKVVREFPELAGIEPTCTLAKMESALAARLDVSLPKKMDQVYVLTFRTELPAADMSITRVVRATVTREGRVIKLSVSK